MAKKKTNYTEMRERADKKHYNKRKLFKIKYCRLCGVELKGSKKLTIMIRVDSPAVFCSACFEEVRDKKISKIRKMIIPLAKIK